MININKLMANTCLIAGLSFCVVSCASVADVNGQTGSATNTASASSKAQQQIYRVRLFFFLVCRCLEAAVCR